MKGTTKRELLVQRVQRWKAEHEAAQHPREKQAALKEVDAAEEALEAHDFARELAREKDHEKRARMLSLVAVEARSYQAAHAAMKTEQELAEKRKAEEEKRRLESEEAQTPVQSVDDLLEALSGLDPATAYELSERLARRTGYAHRVQESTDAAPSQAKPERRTKTI